MKTKDMVLHALFIALTLLLGMTPLGLIPLGFINVTILCIPVIVGTLLFGLRSGLLFGACMAISSILSMTGLSPLVPPSALASALFAVSPFLAIVMCLVPRLMIPVSTHLVYRLCARKKPETKAGIVPAAVAGSLTNTVLYLGLMLCFYVLAGLDAKPILGLIGGVGLIAGSLEAVAAALIATPVTIALRKIKRG
ncbi:MAG: ECF transporter S component [Clostridia bacterium]|nr:ECF transporter S component [Clostridia bacterium]